MNERLGFWLLLRDLSSQLPAAVLLDSADPESQGEVLPVVCAVVQP